MGNPSPTPVPAPTPSNLVGQLLQGVVNSIQTVAKQLAPEEIVAVSPAFITFWTFVNNNPLSLTNPLEITPQVMMLETALIAAQSTVRADLTKDGASSQVTMWQSLQAAAKAKLGQS